MRLSGTMIDRAADILDLDLFDLAMRTVLVAILAACAAACASLLALAYF